MMITDKVPKLIKIVMLLAITTMILCGCGRNAGENVTETGNSNSVDLTAEQVTIENLAGQFSIILSPIYHRENRFQIDNTNWVDVSMAESNFDPEEDMEGEIELKSGLSDDFVVTDKGTMDSDIGKMYWYEATDVEDAEPVKIYSLFFPMDEGDGIIRVIGLNDESNTLDYETIKSMPYDWAAKTDWDQLEHGNSLIYGLALNNESFLPRTSTLNIDKKYIEIEGIPVGVIAETIFGTGYSEDGLLIPATPKDTCMDEVSSLKNQGKDYDYGEIEISGKDCYWYQSNEINPVLNQYVLCMPHSDEGVIKLTLGFNGDINSDETQQEIERITQSIKFNEE